MLTLKKLMAEYRVGNPDEIQGRIGMEIYDLMQCINYPPNDDVFIIARAGSVGNAAKIVIQDDTIVSCEDCHIAQATLMTRRTAETAAEALLKAELGVFLPLHHRTAVEAQIALICQMAKIPIKM